MFMFLQHSFKKVIASNLSVGFIQIGIFFNMLIKYPLFHLLSPKGKDKSTPRIDYKSKENCQSNYSIFIKGFFSPLT